MSYLNHHQSALSSGHQFQSEAFWFGESPGLAALIDCIDFPLSVRILGVANKKSLCTKKQEKSHHINIKKWRKREMNAKYVIVIYYSNEEGKICHQLFLDGRGPVETSTRISAVHHHLHRSIYGISFFVIFHFPRHFLIRCYE